jgi:hypothetical protein
MNVISTGVAAGILGLSAVLANGFMERQEALEASRNAELTKLEDFHSAVVAHHFEAEEARLKWIRENTFPPMEEMTPLAERCFKSWNCYKLAEAIYHEDRGGGIQGMKAVANVIINRVNGHKFPSTIAGVVNQKRRNERGVMVCQFSYVCTGKVAMKDHEWKIKAGWIALKAYRGQLKDRTNGADHYYNPDKVAKTPKFAKEYTQVASISDHLFYRSTAVQ